MNPSLHWPQYAFFALLTLQALFFLFWIVHEGTEGRHDVGIGFVVFALYCVGFGTAFEIWLLWCGGFFTGGFPA